MNGRLSLYSLAADDNAAFWKKRQSGLLVPVFSGPNLIVNEGRKTSVKYLGEAVPAENKYLNTLKAGTGGHEEGDPTTPIPPVASDTELEDEEPITVPLYAKAYVPPGVGTALQLIFLMDLDEGNGEGSVTYTEALLLSADGTPFARETFPGVLKDETKKLYFEWTIM